MNSFKNDFAVLEAKKAGDAAGVEEHFAELDRAEIGVNPGRDDDAAACAFGQQVGALLGEELEEIDVGADFAAIYRADLIGVLAGGAEKLADMGEGGKVTEPGGLDFWIAADDLGFRFLEILNGHLVAGDGVAEFLEKFLGVRFEDVPRRVGDDGVEATAVDDDFVEFVGPVEGFEGVDVGDAERAFFGFALFTTGVGSPLQGLVLWGAGTQGVALVWYGLPRWGGRVGG